MSAATPDPSDPAGYAPEQTALLLLDFYQYFVDHNAGPHAQAALDIAIELRAFAVSKGMTIVHALLNVEESPFDTCKGRDRLSVAIGALRNDRRNSSQRTGGQGFADNEWMFMRQPGIVSALESPGLMEYLQSKGAESVLLCGLSTSGCVLRTAVAATDAQYVTTVVSDACADADQAVHEMLVEKVLPSRAWIMTAAEVQKLVS